VSPKRLLHLNGLHCVILVSQKTTLLNDRSGNLTPYTVVSFFHWHLIDLT
jgi:hypothetical protein